MAQKLNALVVDDSPDIREILRRVLEKNWISVIEAEDGPSALEELKKCFFNIVLLDIHLPGPSGLEILKQLRQVNRDSKVVMITGDASFKNVIQALDDSAFAYLEKPINLKDLQATVCQAVVQQHEEMRLQKPLAARLRGWR
jgi:DNA-binding NtrC family response regulator